MTRSMTRFWMTVLVVLTLVGGGAWWLRSQTALAPALPDAPDASTAPPTAPPDLTADYTVIPGQRVGPVTAQTSRADLATLYGEAALADRDIAVGEGFLESGTVVHGGTDEQFAVVWVEGGRDRPRQIKDFGPAWKTPEGLGVGSSYAAVQSALGSFQLYGFGWDYGGTVMLTDSRLDRYDGYLWLRTSPTEAAIDTHPQAFQALQGDRLIPGDAPDMVLLDPVVYDMTVSFESPDP